MRTELGEGPEPGRVSTPIWYEAPELALSPSTALRTGPSKRPACDLLKRGAGQILPTAGDAISHPSWPFG
jgi:hypothetical protein